MHNKLKNIVSHKGMQIAYFVNILKKNQFIWMLYSATLKQTDQKNSYCLWLHEEIRTNKNALWCS